MSLGTNPENFAILFLVFLGALPAAFLLLWVGVLVKRLLRIESNVFSVAFLALIFVGPFIGGSLYLDTAGTVVKAQVLTRTERIHYREEGDWSHEYRITAQYTVTDQPPLTASFAPDAAIFDQLHPNESIDLRAVSLGGWFSYVRFANQTTLTWLPWRWIGIGLLVMLVGWLLWQLSKRTRWGWVLTAILLLALATLPLLFKLREGERSQDISLTPLRATATVQEVERVTRLDPLPEHGSGDSRWDTEIDVPQPYDIVVVRFIPKGHEQAVLGVDAVDAEHPMVKADTLVEIAYAESDPRTVRLLNAHRSHYWKNPLGWVGTQLGGLALVVLVVVGFTWLGGRFSRMLDSRIERAKEIARERGKP